MTNANATPVIGDKVFLIYGMGGTDEGTLYGIEETKWGPNYRVKLENGKFEICSNLDCSDVHTAIGAYYQPTSKLRQ